MITTLVIFAIIVLAIFLKMKFHRKKLRIKKKDRTVFVNNVELEYADIQHYIDTKKEFEDRQNILQIAIAPSVDIVQNELREDVPDIIDYHIDIDTQNVHDNAIQKNIKGVYEKIFQTQQPLSSCREEILDYVEDEAKRAKVLGVIDKIQKRNAFVTNLNSREEDVLKNIWFGGNTNVREQLINEILDCVDSHDMLYCPTGVTSRLTSALHIDSPEKAPKTKDLLDQEIISTFGKHYNDIPDKALAREKTIDGYYSVYPREMISDMIDKWIEHI